MTAEGRPDVVVTGAVDEQLTEAARTADLAAYLAIVTAGQVCVPLLEEPQAEQPLPWAVVRGEDDADLLPVFTAVEHLTDFGGEDVPFAAVPFAELLADWPDPAWGLIVDPGKPWSLLLAAATLGELRDAARPAALTNG